ncbi:MAG TPA: SRPBCC domain-containing protein [Steroidobacteraceae bacterium]|nr:SRPBCC domain-containing protein [Steroidobacteraceae bacterium]
MTATRTLVIEKEMPHAPEKVWRALIQGALIKEWLMDNDFQPVVGHKFSFRSTPMANWNGVVDSAVPVVEPHKRLSYSWGSQGLESGNWNVLSPA